MTTFVARLRELDGTTVRLGVDAGDEVTGVLRRRARPACRVTDRDGGRAYVPIGVGWWVRPVDVD